MGVVYLAREVSLDRPVAIKLLPPELAAKPGLRERFLREARTAAQLSHPNIVPIHAVDEGAGFVYFVMAYIDGDTLGERIRTLGPLPPADAARVLREIAWALGYAHAQGVIHRDLKPDNIMLERASGRAVLTDFGIARRLETTGHTDGGELIGTPEFMSPEQCCGGDLDGRTDLYSLGAVGFYALAGRVPFEADSIPALLIMQVSAPPPPLAPLAPGAPRALAQAVMRCLEKEPSARHEDAKTFADALSTALETRREIPPPVRAFVKDSLEIRATGCLFLAGITWLVPAMLVPFLILARAAPTPVTVFIGFFVMVATLAVVPFALHVRRIRRLIRAGYGVEDVIAGARADLDQKREEIAFTVGREPTRLERVLRVTGNIGGIAALGGILAGMLGLVRFVTSPLVPSLVTLGVGAWVVGLVVSQRRRDVLGERRVKYWNSRFGRWLFKVAGTGLSPRLTAGPSATHRPTELALAFAAEDLYAAMPKEVKAALPELPGVLKKLEQQARQVRARVEQLEQSLADVRGGPATGAAEDRRDALVADLTAARDLASTRLSETVAALETIRLDLLRLRAGAGSVDRITADLTAAGQIGEVVDRLLEAGEEIERALAAKRQGGKEAK